MTEKRFNKILGAVFLIVGIVAATNTFRLHTYIRQTVPRDLAQEQCNTETIKVLEGWVRARIQRDTTMDIHDAATVVVLDRLATGQKPTPEEIGAWRNATVADRQVRLDATATHADLPQC